MRDGDVNPLEKWKSYINLPITMERVANQQRSFCKTTQSNEEK